MKIIIAIFFIMSCGTLRLPTQELHKEDLRGLDSEMNARYSWYYEDKYHSGAIILTLFKNGRYKYNAAFPLGAVDSSEGTYKKIKNKIILNSDFQKDGVGIALRYADSLTGKSVLLSPYPVNLENQICYHCSYMFNKDSTSYYPIDIINGQNLPEISWLKVNFYGNQFSSAWVKVDNPGFPFQVILPTNIDFNEYRNKVMKNTVYKIKKDRIKLLKNE